MSCGQLVFVRFDRPTFLLTITAVLTLAAAMKQPFVEVL